jgi:hypothetical protein
LKRTAAPALGQHFCHSPAQTADDAVGAQDADIQVDDMHRPAFAAAVARRLAKQLGHHQVESAAFGDAVSVSSMGAGDVIVTLQCGTGACSHSLLPKAQMDSPVQPDRREHLPDRLFEQADTEHRPEELDLIRRRGGWPTGGAGLYIALRSHSHIPSRVWSGPHLIA